MGKAFEAFRAPSTRPANYRWMEASKLAEAAQSRMHLTYGQSNRAPWHDDEYIRNAARLCIMTSRWSMTPMPEEIREGDAEYMTAIDLMSSDYQYNTRQTIECLLLSGADDEFAGMQIDIDPRVIRIAHELFFNVRPMLNKPLLVQDRCFSPTIMQGGCRGPLDVNRIIAYASGPELYYAYRTGMNDGSAAQEVLQRIQQALISNQTISALLRRSFSHESTEQIVNHAYDRILLEMRADQNANTGENEPMRRIRNGVQNFTEHNLKPEVAVENDPSFASKTESVTATTDAIKEVLQ